MGVLKFVLKITHILMKVTILLKQNSATYWKSVGILKNTKNEKISLPTIFKNGYWKPVTYNFLLKQNQTFAQAKIFNALIIKYHFEIYPKNLRNFHKTPQNRFCSSKIL